MRPFWRKYLRLAGETGGFASGAVARHLGHMMPKRVNSKHMYSTESFRWFVPFLFHFSRSRGSLCAGQGRAAIQAGGPWWLG